MGFRWGAYWHAKVDMCLGWSKLRTGYNLWRIKIFIHNIWLHISGRTQVETSQHLYHQDLVWSKIWPDRPNHQNFLRNYWCSRPNMTWVYKYFTLLWIQKLITPSLCKFLVQLMTQKRCIKHMINPSAIGEEYGFTLQCNIYIIFSTSQ